MKIIKYFKRKFRSQYSEEERILLSKLKRYGPSTQPEINNIYKKGTIVYILNEFKEVEDIEIIGTYDTPFLSIIGKGNLGRILDIRKYSIFKKLPHEWIIHVPDEFISIYMEFQNIIDEKYLYESLVPKNIQRKYKLDKIKDIL